VLQRLARGSVRFVGRGHVLLKIVRQSQQAPFLAERRKFVFGRPVGSQKLFHATPLGAGRAKFADQLAVVLVCHPVDAHHGPHSRSAWASTPASSWMTGKAPVTSLASGRRCISSKLRLFWSRHNSRASDQARCSDSVASRNWQTPLVRSAILMAFPHA